MVDALRSAARVLRRGGSVVDLQPAAHYTPRLAIVSGDDRTEVGDISRNPDEGVVAAHRARSRALADGVLARVVSTHGVHRVRYGRMADLDWVMRQNDNWRIAPVVRRRLSAAWRRRPDGAQIEMRRAFSVAVLRKRG